MPNYSSCVIFYYDNYKFFVPTVDNLPSHILLQSNLSNCRYIKNFYHVIFEKDPFIKNHLSKEFLSRCIVLRNEPENYTDIVKIVDDQASCISYLFMRPAYPFLQYEKIEYGFDILQKTDKNKIFFGRLIKSYNSDKQSVEVVPSILPDLFIIHYNLLYNDHKENTFFVELSLVETLNLCEPQEYELIANVSKKEE